MARMIAAAVAVLVVYAGISASAQEQQAPSGNAEGGKTLFKADGCWECHGTVGQGGGFSGPRIGPMELPYESFLMQLRTPRENMPPYEAAVLSNGDATNIYAFLKAIPKPPDPSSIAILH